MSTQKPAARMIPGPPQPKVLEPGTTAPPLKKDHPIKVRATAVGFYENCRRRVGDVFTIADQVAFSDKWMEVVSARTPEHTTSAPAALKQAHHELVGGEARRVDRDDDDVFGDDDK